VAPLEVSTQRVFEIAARDLWEHVAGGWADQGDPALTDDVVVQRRVGICLVRPREHRVGLERQPLAVRLAVVEVVRRRVPPRPELLGCDNVRLDCVRARRDPQEQIGDGEAVVVGERA
jgi:hypothetical protein